MYSNIKKGYEKDALIQNFQKKMTTNDINTANTPISIINGKISI